MATVSEVKVIVSGEDRTAGVFSGVSGSLKSLSTKFGDLINDSKVASAAFAVALGAMANKLVSVASNMEDAKVSFDTMLGSASAGSKLLSEISDFAKKTPFDLPQVVEGSKRLLAYNVAAKDIIPTFEMLGNIAAGVGKDKLPQLIIAFGQVKAATKLTGAELRQFTEAGVPLLQALVDKANETGGSLTAIGGASKETTKKMASLASSIVNTEFEMDYFKKTGGKTTEQLKAMAQKVDLNKAKLNAFGPVAEKVFVKVKTTAADMIDKISDGAVKFEDVQAALKGMTDEGGKFNNLMERLSNTFGGKMSNIRDQLVRIGLAVMGISTEAETFGEVIKGGPFDMLSQAATKVLDAFNMMEPKVKPFIQWFSSNGLTMGTTLGILAGGLIGVTVAMWGFLGPLALMMGIVGAVGAVLGFIITQLGGVQGITDKVNASMKWMQDKVDKAKEAWTQFKEKVFIIVDDFKDKADAMKKAFDDNKDSIMKVVEVLGVFFGPALVIATGKMLLMGAAAIWNATIAFAQLIAQLGKLAIKLAVEGVLALGKFIAQLVIMGFTAIWNATVALAQLIGAMIRFALAGWGAVFALMAQIVQLALHAAALTVHAIAVGISTAGTWLLTAATWALNAAFVVLTSPITLIIVAIGLLILAGLWLIKHWGEIKAVAIETWAKIKAWLIEKWEETKAKAVEIWEGIKTWLADTWDSIKEKAGSAWESIRDAIVNPIKSIIDWAGQAINKLKEMIGLNSDGKKISLSGGGSKSAQTGGVIPGPVNQAVPIVAHGGERVIPAGIGGGRSGGGASMPVLNVYVGLYAGSETEKRNIAKELYSALVQLAGSQNKTVSELMGA